MRQLLADGRAVKDMSVEELSARFRTARKYNENEKLPAGVRAQLSKIAKELARGGPAPPDSGRAAASPRPSSRSSPELRQRS
ncbi:MAG: hypothetical protein HC855_16450 [Rhizobiales bacterium]|nr:hypothetical protein [Hyphomicrobiales bacterium]